MIDPEWLKEREEATNRLFSEIEKLPCYPEVSRRVRDEYEQVCNARRARLAAAIRWKGHSPVEWTSVRIPRALASELREIYPRLSFGKAIQRLLDFRRRASL